MIVLFSVLISIWMGSSALVTYAGEHAADERAGAPEKVHDHWASARDLAMSYGLPHTEAQSAEGQFKKLDSYIQHYVHWIAAQIKSPKGKEAYKEFFKNPDYTSLAFMLRTLEVSDPELGAVGFLENSLLTANGIKGPDGAPMLAAIKGMKIEDRTRWRNKLLGIRKEGKYLNLGIQILVALLDIQDFPREVIAQTFGSNSPFDLPHWSPHVSQFRALEREADENAKDLEKIAEKELKFLPPTAAATQLKMLPAAYREAMLALWPHMRVKARSAFQDLLMNPTVEKVDVALKTWNPDYLHYLQTSEDRLERERERILDLLLADAGIETESFKKLPEAVQKDVARELESALERAARARAETEAKPEISVALAAAKDRLNALPSREKFQEIKKIHDAIVEKYYRGTGTSPGMRTLVERILREEAARKYLRGKLESRRVEHLDPDSLRALNIPGDPVLSDLLKPIYRREVMDQMRRGFADQVAQEGLSGEALAEKVKHLMDRELGLHEREIAKRVNDTFEDAVGTADHAGRLTGDANHSGNLGQAIGQCIEEFDKGNEGADQVKRWQERAADLEAQARSLEQRGNLLIEEAIAEGENDGAKKSRGTFLLQSARHLAGLTELKRKGVTFLPIHRKLPQHDSRVQRWKDLETQVMQQFSYWASPIFEKNADLARIRSEIKQIATMTLNQEKIAALAKEEVDEDVYPAYQKAAKDLRCALLSKHLNFHQAFNDLEVLSFSVKRNYQGLSPLETRVRDQVQAWMQKNQVNWDSIPRRKTEKILEAPCAAMLGREECAKQVGLQGQNLRNFQARMFANFPEELRQIVQPLLDEKFKEKKARIIEFWGSDPFTTGDLREGGLCYDHRPNWLNPNADAKRQFFNGDDNLLVAAIMSDVLRDEARDNLHTVQMGLEREHEAEALAVQDITKAHYRELAVDCIQLINQRSPQPIPLFSVTDVNDVEAAADLLMKFQRIRDEGKSLISGLTDPKTGGYFDEPFIDDKLVEIGDQFKRLGIKLEGGVEDVIEGLEDKARKEVQHRAGELDAILAKLKPYGFEWDGGSLLFTKARFHEFRKNGPSTLQTVFDRFELQRLLTDLGKFGKYAELHISPWDELKQWLYDSYRQNGFAPRFELNDHTALFIGGLGWHNRESAYMSPSEFMDDFMNVTSNIRFVDLKAERKRLTEFLHKIVGEDPSHSVGGALGEYGRFRKQRLDVASEFLPDANRVGLANKYYDQVITNVLNMAGYLRFAGNIKLKIDGQDVPASLVGENITNQVILALRGADSTIVGAHQSEELDSAQTYWEWNLYLAPTFVISGWFRGAHAVIRIIAMAGVGWTAASMMKPTLEAYYSWKTDEEVVLPWSQWLPFVQRTAVTFGLMAPVSGAYAAWGLRGGFLMNTANGVATLGTTTFAVDVGFGEDVDKAAIHALKTAPYGIAYGNLVGRVPGIGSRVWMGLPASAGAVVLSTAAYTGTGIGLSYLEHLMGGYHDRLGNKLDNFTDIAVDSAVNSGVFDVIAGMGAARQARSTALRARILNNPNENVQSYLSELRAERARLKAETAELEGKRFKIFRHPIKTLKNSMKNFWEKRMAAEERAVMEALAEITPTELLRVNERVPQAKDPVAERNRVNQLLDVLGEISGFTDRVAFLDAMKEHQANNAGWVNNQRTLAEVSESVRDIGRRNLIAKVEKEGGDVGDLVNHPLFLKDGQFDLAALRAIPLDKLDLRFHQKGIDIALNKPEHVSLVEQLANRLGLKSEELLLFLRNYRSGAGETLKMALEAFQTRNPEMIKDILVKEKLPVRLAEQFFGNKVIDALRQLSFSEIQQLIKTKNPLLQKLSAALGMEPRILIDVIAKMPESTNPNQTIKDPNMIKLLEARAAEALSSYILDGVNETARQIRLGVSLEQNPFLRDSAALAKLPIRTLDFNTSEVGEMITRQAANWSVPSSAKLLEFLKTYRGGSTETLESAITLLKNPSPEALRAALIEGRIPPGRVHDFFGPPAVREAVIGFTMGDLRGVFEATDENAQELAGALASHIGVAKEYFIPALQDILKQKNWKQTVAQSLGGISKLTADRYTEQMKYAGENAPQVMDQMIANKLFQSRNYFHHVPLKYLDPTRKSHQDFIERVASLHGYDKGRFTRYFAEQQHVKKTFSGLVNDFRAWEKQKGVYDAEEEAKFYSELMENSPEKIKFSDLVGIVQRAKTEKNLDRAHWELANVVGVSQEALTQLVSENVEVMDGEMETESWKRLLRGKAKKYYEDEMRKAFTKGDKKRITELFQSGPYLSSVDGREAVLVFAMNPEDPSQSAWIDEMAEAYEFDKDSFQEFFQAEHSKLYNLSTLISRYRAAKKLMANR